MILLSDIIVYINVDGKPCAKCPNCGNEVVLKPITFKDKLELHKILKEKYKLEKLK